MHLAPRPFAARCAVVLVVASLIPAAAWAAFPPRAPQIPFLNGSLQGYLNGVGESINTLTDQIDAQTFITSVSGNAEFTLMIELAGFSNANSIGVYNAGAPAPLYQVFPGAAIPGWFASAHFAGGNLVVTLFDQNSIIQGQTFYPGVNASNFGFYIQGPGGTFFSQDFLNGGPPHMLTYAGTGRNSGDWWECFEDSPGPPDFDDAVLMLQSVVPTPDRVHSWGSIKRLYR